MSTKTVTLTVLALVASTGLASAHSTKGIDRTQDRQFEAITEARLKGELTKREYNQLLDEQNRISAMERAAKADGKVTGREIRAIREAQSEARQHIISEANDGQKSWFRRWLYNHR
jgi:uncharacterized membrane protein YebE (DUF533 family)